MKKFSKEYCASCDKGVLGVKDVPNFYIHGALTLFTLGVWGIVWWVLYLKANKNATSCILCHKEIK